MNSNSIQKWQCNVVIEGKFINILGRPENINGEDKSIIQEYQRKRQEKNVIYELYAEISRLANKDFKELTRASLDPASVVEIRSRFKK